MGFPVRDICREAQLSPKRDVAVDQVGSIEHRIDVECVVSEDHSTVDSAEVESLVNRWCIIDWLAIMC